MTSFIGFFIILGPLVVVHELGHFFFAKIFGVRAEVFSVGFGPKLFKKKIGETEWCFSAIPLGGYVKLFGEEPGQELPPEEQKRALQYQRPFARFWIFFGGPLFNFLFAIVIFMAILVIGEQRISSEIGRVVEKSYAEKVGLQTGDKILSIDGEKMDQFRDVRLFIHEHPMQELKFEVLHKGQTEPQILNIRTQSDNGFSIYGQRMSVGKIDGLESVPRGMAVGIENPESVAGKSGLKTGDTIVSINGEQVSNWENLENTYLAIPAGEKFVINYAPKGLDSNVSDENKTVTLIKPSGSSSMALGIGLRSSEMFVSQTTPESPAAKVGVQSDDFLWKVEGVEVYSFMDLKNRIQASAQSGNPVKVTLVRQGQELVKNIQPTVTTSRDPEMKETQEFLIGVNPYMSYGAPPMFTYQVWNPIRLFYEGTARMVEFVYRNVVAITKMLTGQVSVATLGGPLMIGQIAGDSLSRGLVSFLTMMAILSVGLGIVNVLPIPVLDGGHLMMLTFEVIRGKPLTIRQMEVLQQAGFMAIVLLMVVVLRNDIMRSFF